MPQIPKLFVEPFQGSVGVLYITQGDASLCPGLSYLTALQAVCFISTYRHYNRSIRQENPLLASTLYKDNRHSPDNDKDNEQASVRNSYFENTTNVICSLKGCQIR